MTIAVCDDDAAFRRYLAKHLQTYYDDKSIGISILPFASGEELLASPAAFDLIFLDVEMEGINGIRTGSELKKRNPYCIIIVITSYDGYLDDSFRIRAFRFLPKPLDILRLYRALDDAADLLRNDRIVFYDVRSETNVRIYTNDIIYLEIEKRKTKIVTVKDVYYSKERLAYWKERLNNISFVSPHSSYLVNLDYAVYHTRTKLVLAKIDARHNLAARYEIAIAPRKQAEMKRLFFEVVKRR